MKYGQLEKLTQLRDSLTPYPNVKNDRYVLDCYCSFCDTFTEQKAPTDAKLVTVGCKSCSVILLKVYTEPIPIKPKRRYSFYMLCKICGKLNSKHITPCEKYELAPGEYSWLDNE